MVTYNYNMTNITDSTNIAQHFVEVNRTTGGIFAGIALISLWFILFIILSGRRLNNPAEGATGASLVCTVLGLVFAGIGVLDPSWAWGFGALMGLALVGLISQR